MRFFPVFTVLASILLAPCSLLAADVVRSEILKEGQGDPVKNTSIVRVHYTGWLTDSTRFDSSRDRGEPLQFTLGAGMVIAGWDKGILGMKTGEIRRLVVPATLGYGDKAVGPIPANSTLVFEVELISFEKGLEPDAFPKNLSSFQWKTIASGVEIFDENPGQGTEAKPGVRIEVHHTGWLSGGTMFGSSKSQGKPFSVLLGAGKMIKGWELGLSGVRSGMVRWLRVQPTAGYGSTALARIPANSELLYRVEILSMEADENAAELDFFPDLNQLALQDAREGLRIAVVQKPTDSTSAPVKVGQKAKVHYSGWLLDGTSFDSSRGRGQPFEFPLGAGRVIRGWDLGVEGMRAGEKRVLVVPPGLGYGSRGAGPIPADATLVFLVECLGSAD